MLRPCHLKHRAAPADLSTADIAAGNRSRGGFPQPHPACRPLPLDMYCHRYDFPWSAALGHDAYVTAVNRSLYTDGKRPRPQALSTVLELYPPSDDRDANVRMAAEFFTDIQFVCPTRWAAQAAATHGKAPVYLYRYNHAWPDAACGDLYFAKEFGVTHTAEISYVFGMPTFVFGAPAAAANCSLSPTDARFAAALGQRWAALSVGSPPWLSYSTAADRGAVLQPERPDGAGEFGTEAGWHAGPCAALLKLWH